MSPSMQLEFLGMSLGKPEYVSDLVVYLLNRLGVE